MSLTFTALPIRRVFRSPDCKIPKFRSRTTMSIPASLRATCMYSPPHRDWRHGFTIATESDSQSDSDCGRNSGCFSLNRSDIPRRNNRGPDCSSPRVGQKDRRRHHQRLFGTGHSCPRRECPFTAPTCSGGYFECCLPVTAFLERSLLQNCFLFGM